MVIECCISRGKPQNDSIVMEILICIYKLNIFCNVPSRSSQLMHIFFNYSRCPTQVIMVWLAIGSQSHGMKTVLLPLSIEDCPGSNSTWGNSTWGPDTTTEGLPATTDTTEE